MTTRKLGTVLLRFANGGNAGLDVHGFYGDSMQLYTAVPPQQSTGLAEQFTVELDAGTGDVLLFNEVNKTYGFVHGHSVYGAPSDYQTVLFFPYYGEKMQQVSVNTRFQMSSVSRHKVYLTSRSNNANLGVDATIHSDSSWMKAQFIDAQRGQDAPAEVELIPVNKTNVDALIMQGAKACKGGDLSNADLRNADLNGAQFAGIKSIQGADFSGADCSGIHISGFDFGTVGSFHGTSFNGADLTALTTAAGAKLSHAILKKCKLGKLDFTGADLSYADLTDCDLQSCNFTNANLEKADLSGAIVKGADFTGARMHGTNFRRCDLTGATFSAKPDFTRSYHLWMGFAGATVPYRLLGRDWSYYNLSGATVVGLPTLLSSKSDPLSAIQCDLRGFRSTLNGATLAFAVFSKSRFDGLDLSQTDLGNARLVSATFHGTNLSGANLAQSDCSSAQFMVDPKATPGPRGKPLPATPTDAYLANAALDGADLQGVNLDNVQFFYDQMLAGKASARNTSFVDARMTKAFLVGVDFSGSKTAMNGAVLDNSVLVAARFCQADLSVSGA